MYAIKLCLCLSVSLVVMWTEMAGATDVSDDPLGALYTVALNQNWDKALSVAEKHSAVLNEPSGRAIVAHACLAKNQNNRSYGLFASLESVEKLECYAEWTAGLVADGAKMRENPIAHYFRGDALARQSEWRQAQTHFAKATQLDSRLALAWNALGVAHAYQDHFKDAKECFKRATKEDRNLADAYANLGTLLLIIEAGPGALENYGLASDASSNFALVNVGRACVKLGYNRDKAAMNDAISDFNVALATPETKALVESNLRRVLAVSTGLNEEDLKPESLKGTTIHARDLLGLSRSAQDRQVAGMTPSQRQGLLREVNRHAGNVEIGKFLFGGTEARAGANLGASAKSGSLRGFTNLFGEVRQNMKVFENHLDRRAGELTSLKQVIVNRTPAGGADTVAVALEQSAGDGGTWPTKHTRFGLAPLANLPTVTNPGE